MSDHEVVHNADEQQYEIYVDGKRAGLTKAEERDDGASIFPHTEVDDEYEGQGLGSELVTKALDDIRRRGKRIVVTCPYVAHFIEKHPEYGDLLAEEA